MTDALVIGAGPAGLMAAEELADAGLKVLVADHKPSVGRKFLMAGKSGLNLTKSEDIATFLAAYGDATWLHPMILAFGPDDVMRWANTLDQPTFVGSTGRVFPKVMKTSPLLRSWLARLGQKGVQIQTRGRWTRWNGDEVVFETPNGPHSLKPHATVLALGGASWRKLGSDGTWAAHFSAFEIAAFEPANMGFAVNWSDHMTRHFGVPLKNIAFTVNACTHRGEAIISARGLEGGGIYAVSRAMREGAPLSIDLLPDLTKAQIKDRLTKTPAKASLANRLRKATKLAPAKIALLQEFCRPLPSDPSRLAEALKSVPIRHQGPRPIDEAISTAGGLRHSALDANLMLKSRPGTFAAGEMLDWEAPTGGYLITACLATGRWAGKAAADYALR